MNAINVNPRAMIARVGAALAAFVLAFSLLTMVSPAHADDAKTWTELKFSGEDVSLSLKIHVPEQYGVSTKSLCEKSKSEANSTKIGRKVDKIEVEQYEGVEVCTIESSGSLSEVVDKSGSSRDFSVTSVTRDGDNIKVKGSGGSVTTSGASRQMRITFDGGVVSSSGGEVDGNTFIANGGSFEVVGKPGSGSNMLMYAPIGAVIGGGIGLVVFFVMRSKKKAQPQQFASPYAAQPGQYPQGQAAPGAQQPGVPQQPQPNPQQPYNPNAQGGQGV